MFISWLFRGRLSRFRFATCPIGAASSPRRTSYAPGAPQVYGAFKRSAKEAKGGAKLSTIEAAVLGSGASLAAQAVTTPLDVVRTRVMTASSDDEGYEGVWRSTELTAPSLCLLRSECGPTIVWR